MGTKTPDSKTKNKVKI